MASCPVLMRHAVQGARGPLGNNWSRDNRGNRDRNGKNGRDRLAVDLYLGAFAGNVTLLAAAVASLSGSVEGSTIGCSAVAGDVTKLATSVALHGLCLAITSEMVGPAALVAGGRTSTSSEAATREAAKASTRGTASTTTKAGSSWVRTGALQTGLECLRTARS
jgi:hypothetical protein